MMKEKIAKGLLDSKAVTLNVNTPYTWASGLKSPIYCDNRITLSYPSLRKEITQGLSELVQTHFKDVDAIVGVATGGLPQGALVADALDLPLSYVRPTKKGHGQSKLVEGHLTKGSSVVLIEDLISTGGSSLNAVKAVEASGAIVLGVVAVFTYGLQKAKENFKHIPLITLSDYETLIEVAKKENYIAPDDLDILKSWREDPEKYGSKV